MATNQENIDLSKSVSKSSVVLPNSILLIALVYFSFIVEQDSSTSSASRTIIYSLLVIFDILALIFINTDYYFFKKVKTILTEFIMTCCRKILGKSGEILQEKPDEIQEFVEYIIILTYLLVNQYNKIFFHKKSSENLFLTT